MHILICDDDAAFGARMAEYVTVYFTARSVQVHTAVCTSAAEVLATPGLELYQLAFLDVDMPGANGMVLGRQLKQKCPGLMLVYVSAYLEFLAEIFADEFSGLAPGNDVDEICFLFPGLAFEIAVAGDGEAGHRKTGLRTAQFRVTGQSAHDNNLIQHRFPPPVLPRH